MGSRPHFQLSAEGRRGVPSFRKIRPCGIGDPNQCNFLFAPPALQFLFARDGCSDLSKNFNVDQTLDPVPGGKSLWVVVRFVLQNAPPKMPSYSDVEGQRATGHDVHAVRFRLLHARSISDEAGMSSDGAHAMRFGAGGKLQVPRCARNDTHERVSAAWANCRFLAALGMTLIGEFRRRGRTAGSSLRFGMTLMGELGGADRTAGPSLRSG